MAGGYNGTYLASAEVYDPGAGTWSGTASLSTAHSTHTATLLTSGKVLVAGGRSSGTSYLALSEVYEDTGAQDVWRPVVTGPSSAEPGATITVTGSGFRGVSSGSSGNFQDSSTNYPLVVLQSLDGARLAHLPAAQFSDTTADVTLPNWPAGYYLLWVNTSGISGGTSINVSPIPTKLGFTSQPSSTAAGASISPVIRVTVQDTNGNPVASSNANVTLAIGTDPGSGTLSGTTTVAASSGVATFSNLSIDKAGNGYTLVATSGTLTGATSSAFNITPGAATKLAITAQPTNTVAGASISPAIQVTVLDPNGNTVTPSTANVTLVIATNPGAGRLSGTTTVAAVNGVATFSNLSIDKIGNGYTLVARSGTLTAATSGAFNVTPGAATKLAVTAQPTNTVAGASISPSIQVAVRDANGNTVTSSSANVTLKVATNPGAGTLSGTTTVAAVDGVATFPNLSIDKTGSGYTLVATSGTLTAATSSAFNITPGAATNLAITVQPSNTVAGASISPAIQVTVRDATGNTDTFWGAKITVALSNNPAGGVLSGTVSRNAVAGVATFDDLSIDKVATGYVLRATSGALTPATSASFDIDAAGAAKLAFAVQPSNTAAGASFTPFIEVAVQDGGGSTATGSTASITLVLGKNPGGGTLSGTSTVAAVAGVATFSDLSIDKVGNGYTLVASSGSLVGATSASFDIGAPLDRGFSCGCQNASSGALAWLALFLLAVLAKVKKNKRGLPGGG